MRIGEHIKTFALVTLVTAVIWVFAESESLTTRPVRAEVTFELDPTSDHSLEIVDPAWRERVDVTLEGATGAVSEAETVLRRAVKLRPGMPGIPSEPGEQTADLAAAIRSLAELQGKPVTVVRTDPPSMRFRIDQLVTREIKVVVDAPGAELDGQPEPRPATVKVITTESDARLITEASVATARLTVDTMKRVVPGRKEMVSNVAVEPPAEIAGPKTRVVPPRIDVGLTVKSRTASYTIASVPVYILVAAVEYERWDVSVPPEDRFLTDVQVSGPGELVDQVRRGEIKVTAKVELTFDELERGISSKEVSFSQLPTALNFTADNTRVRLQIRKREPTPR